MRCSSPPDHAQGARKNFGASFRSADAPTTLAKPSRAAFARPLQRARSRARHGHAVLAFLADGYTLSRALSDCSSDKVRPRKHLRRLSCRRFESKKAQQISKEPRALLISSRSSLEYVEALYSGPRMSEVGQKPPWWRNCDLSGLPPRMDISHRAPHFLFQANTGSRWKASEVRIDQMGHYCELYLKSRFDRAGGKITNELVW